MRDWKSGARANHIIDWIIFTGETQCGLGDSCHTEAYWTKDGGKQWTLLATYVRDCEWGRDAYFTQSQRSLIFCSQYKEKSGNMRWQRGGLELYRSDDMFQSSKKIFDNIIGFAISEKFMVVADISNGADNMVLHVSQDGASFSAAAFPPNVAISKAGYTVLESSTGTIFLDVFTNTARDREWGTLFVSNSNGAFYTQSLEYTNRNTDGYVDYEKMLGIEGTFIINQVGSEKS